MFILLNTLNITNLGIFVTLPTKKIKLFHGKTSQEEKVIYLVTYFFTIVTRIAKFFYIYNYWYAYLASNSNRFESGLGKVEHLVLYSFFPQKLHLFLFLVILFVRFDLVIEVVLVELSRVSMSDDSLSELQEYLNFHQEVVDSSNFFTKVKNVRAFYKKEVVILAVLNSYKFCGFLFIVKEVSILYIGYDKRYEAISLKNGYIIIDSHSITKIAAITKTEYNVVVILAIGVKFFCVSIKDSKDKGKRIRIVESSKVGICNKIMEGIY
uniref:BPH_3 domain-containing protein n=1 Tax=Heterorhabditis bacteriophora TaxID=37862 RepID=A0A1I7WBE2_HETBA